MTDDRTRGQRFVLSLIGGLIALSLVYVALHATVSDDPPCCPVEPNLCATPEEKRDCSKEKCSGLTWLCFARVDERGVLHFLNASDVDWYVGAQRARDIRAASNERAERIDTLRTSVHQKSAKIRRKLLPEQRKQLDEVLLKIERGDYDRASALFDDATRELGDSSARDLGDEIRDARAALGELRTVLVAQCSDARQLTPPLARLFFWTSPTWSILEVFFWAAFGVLTNLLVNSAEYLRKNTFKPAERWVAYTKLTYGPILAMMLVLAMINGFFQPESFEVRVWTLPLVGFIFGYAARRTANLFDKLAERFLGSVEKGIDAGPEAVRQKQRELVDELMQAYRPRNYEEMREQAKRIADELVEVAVTEREANR